MISVIMLFVFPLTLTFIDMKYSAAVVCIVATAAAIHEWGVIACLILMIVLGRVSKTSRVTGDGIISVK